MMEQNLQLFCHYNYGGVPTVPAGKQVAIGIKVETNENEGSTFTIQLPLQ